MLLYGPASSSDAMMTLGLSPSLRWGSPLWPNIHQAQCPCFDLQGAARASKGFRLSIEDGTTMNSNANRLIVPALAAGSLAIFFAMKPIEWRNAHPHTAAEHLYVMASGSAASGTRSTT